MVRDLRRFDVLLLLAALALVSYGLALIYSGSIALYGSGHAALTHAVFKQAGFAIAGLALSILALLAVLALGQRSFGSRRWFSLGGQQVQPSELAKLATIVFLAKYLSD